MPLIRLFDSVESAHKSVPDRRAVRARIDGHAFCISRLGDRFFASSDTCPHLGESLSKGVVNYLGEIVCPWHSYRFQLTTGQECENRTGYLKLFPVEVNNQGVFVDLPA